MSVVVPVRVSRVIAEKIKELVDTGLYSNRSNLIREALRRFIISESMLTRKVDLEKIAVIVSAMISWNENSVRDIILFGSVARREATVESDIDLLVLVENAESWVVRQRLYGLIYAVIPTLEVDVSLIVINRKRFIRMVDEGDPFALSVIREGIQLYGGFLIEYSKSTLGKGC